MARKQKLYTGADYMAAAGWTSQPQDQQPAITTFTDGDGRLDFASTLRGESYQPPQEQAPEPALAGTSQQPSDLQDAWQGVKNSPSALFHGATSIANRGVQWLGEHVVQPVAKPATALYDIATNWNDPAAGLSDADRAEVLRERGASMTPEQRAAFAPAKARFSDEDLLSRAGRQGAAYSGAKLQELDKKVKPGGYGQMVQGGLASAGQNIGNIALAYATAGTSAAPMLVQNLTLALMGAQSGLLAYGEKRDAGFSVAQADVMGAGSGGLEVATEKAPLGKFMDLISPDAKRGAMSFVKKLGEYGLQDIGGEMINTLVSDVLYGKMSSHPGLTQEEAAKAVSDYFSSGEFEQAMKMTAGTTLVQTGVMGGGAALLRRSARNHGAGTAAHGVNIDVDLVGGTTVTDPQRATDLNGRTAEQQAERDERASLIRQLRQQNQQIVAGQQQQAAEQAQAQQQAQAQAQAAQAAEEQRWNSLTPEQQAAEKLTTYTGRLETIGQNIAAINDQLSDPAAIEVMPPEEVKALKSKLSVLKSAQKAANENIKTINEQFKPATPTTADMYSSLANMQTVGPNAMQQGTTQSADAEVLGEQIASADLTAGQGQTFAMPQQQAEPTADLPSAETVTPTVDTAPQAATQPVPVEQVDSTATPATTYALPSTWKQSENNYANTLGDRATRKRDGSWNVHDALGGTPENVPTLDEALDILAFNEDIILKRATTATPKAVAQPVVAEATHAQPDVTAEPAAESQPVVAAQKPARTGKQAKPKTRNMFGDIAAAGGIDPASFKGFMDTNETNRPAYSKIKKRGGFGLDQMARMMQERGWLVPNDVNGNVDSQAFADMVYNHATGRDVIHSEDVERVAEARYYEEIDAIEQTLAEDYTELSEATTAEVSSDMLYEPADSTAYNEAMDFFGQFMEGPDAEAELQNNATARRDAKEAERPRPERVVEGSGSQAGNEGSQSPKARQAQGGTAPAASQQRTADVKGITNEQQATTGRNNGDRPGPTTTGATGRGGSEQQGRHGARPAIRMAGEELVPTPRSFVGPDSFNSSLDQHQQLGVNLALTRFEQGGTGFLLADGTGVGKTREILAIASEMAAQGPVLIVTQNQSVINDSFKRDAQAMDVSMDNISLITYSALTKGHRSDRYKLVIFDEAHNLKNDAAAKTVAAQNLQADHFVYATATPMDRPTGAVYFLRQVSGKTDEEIYTALGLAYNYQENEDGSIKEWYTLDKGMTWGTYLDNLVKLRDELIREGGMVRREYPFFGKVSVKELELNDNELSAQSQIEDYWDGLIESARSMTYKRNMAGQKTMELGRWTEGMKVAHVYDMVKQGLAEGKSVVVMAEGVNNIMVKGLNDFEANRAAMIGAMSKQLSQDGVRFSELYGSSKTGKSQAIEDFQNGTTQVLLATPQSGGTGVNLDDVIGDKPRLVIVTNMNFSGDVHDQIIGRVSRRNTASAAEVVFPVFKNSTSDSRRSDILKKKLETLRRIQAGDDLDLSQQDEDAVQTAEVHRPGFIVENLSEDGLVVVTGDTYKHKTIIKQLGGRWDKGRGGWIMQEEAADRLLAGDVRPPAASQRSGLTHNKRDAAIITMAEEGNSAKEILEHVIKTSTDKLQVEVAKLLSKLDNDVNLEVMDLGGEALGLYFDPMEGHKATVQLDMNGESAVSVFLHELVHHATRQAIWSDSTAAKLFKSRLNQIKAQARELMQKQGKDAEDYYGLREGSHIEELVAEIFTSPELIDALKQLEMSSKPGVAQKIKNMWGKVVALISDILRGGQVNHPAVREIMEISAGFMALNNPNAVIMTETGFAALQRRTEDRILKTDQGGNPYEDLSRPTAEGIATFQRTVGAIRQAIKGSATGDAGQSEAQARREASRIKLWAITNKSLFSDEQFTDEWTRQQSDAPDGVFSGAEQRVVALTIDGADVVHKSKHLLPTETWASYLDRLEWHNKIFPDTFYQLLGFSTGKDSAGVPTLYARVQQPFIGRKLDADGQPIQATEEQIRAYMEAKGFRSFVNPRLRNLGAKAEEFKLLSWINGDAVVGDLHPGNVWLDVNDKIRVFDPTVDRATEADMKAALEDVSTEEVDEMVDSFGPAAKLRNAPMVASRSLKAAAERAMTAVRDVFVSPAALVGDDYRILRYLTGGKIDMSNLEARQLMERAKAAWDDPELSKATYAYLTTVDADPNMITDPALREAAMQAKDQIMAIGEELVAMGIMKQETLDKRHGSYLPRIYLYHMLGSDVASKLEATMDVSQGGGKYLDFGYLKQRNEDLPEEIRKHVLQQIEDPAYLMFMAIARPQRDMAIHEWLTEIAGNKDWVMPKMLVDWNINERPTHLIGNNLEYTVNSDGTYNVTQKVVEWSTVSDKNVSLKWISENMTPDLAGFIKKNASSTWNRVGQVSFKINKGGGFDVSVKRKLISERVDASVNPNQLEGIVGVRRAGWMRAGEITTKRGDKTYVRPVRSKGGMQVTPFWLTQESARLRALARVNARASEADRDATLKLADRMHDLAHSTAQAAGYRLDAEGNLANKLPDAWRQIPNSPRYGALAGMVVNKHVYVDIVGMVGSGRKGELTKMQHFFSSDPDGTLMQLHRFYKAMKTTYNPGTHVANFGSNAIMAHLFTDMGVKDVMSYAMKAINSIHKKDIWWRHGMSVGFTSASFANNEIGRVNMEMMAYLSSAAGRNATPMEQIKYLAERFNEKTGDLYQLSEVIFKMAVMRYYMEQQNVPKAQAALMAHDTLFDYSDVSPVVRFLRQYYAGIPFVTFQVKVGERVVRKFIQDTTKSKAALLKPGTYTDKALGLWVATRFTRKLMVWSYLIKSVPLLMASWIGLDGDDWEKIKKAYLSAGKYYSMPMLVPHKHDDGKLTFVDLGRFHPVDPFIKMGKASTSGDYLEMINALGIGRNMFFSLFMGMVQNTDAVTGRQIVDERMQPTVGEKVAARVVYLYNLFTPPFMNTKSGAGYKAVNSITGAIDPRTGEKRAEPIDAILTAVGVPATTRDVGKERSRNINRMKLDIQKLKGEFSVAMAGKADGTEDAEKVRAKYLPKLQRAQKKLTDYVRDSDFDTNKF